MICIVIGASLIGISHQFLGFVFRDAVFLNCAFDLVFFFCINKDVAGFRQTAEHIVGASADDDAGAFVRDPANGIELCQEKPLIQRQAFRAAFTGAHSGRQAVEEAVFRFHFCTLDHFLAEAGFFGDPIQELLVVERYIQLFGQALTDQSASTTELSAYRDYLLIIISHNCLL